MMVWQEWQQWPAAWLQVASRWFVQTGERRRLIAAVNLVLILCLSYSLAVLSWRLLPAIDQAPVPVLNSATMVSQQKQPALNIARWHLFGDYDAKPVARVQRVEDMPETRLKLVLRGVFSGEDGSASGAIIAAPTGKQSFYALGADLPGGAVLKEVHARHIVLLRNGNLETLRLPSDKIKDVGSEAANNTRLPVGRSQPQQSLYEYRKTLLENPQQLADVVQARPYRRDGVRGYQVNPGRDPALFSRLGLQPNDVIVAVNNIKLDNPARGLSVLQTLKQDGPVTVDVLRAGVTQTLSIDINQ